MGVVIIVIIIVYCRGRLPTTFIHQSISAPNVESFLSLASIRTEVYLCIISQIDNPPNYMREEEEVFLDVRTLLLLEVDSKKNSRELFIIDI